MKKVNLILLVILLAKMSWSQDISSFSHEDFINKKHLVIRGELEDGKYRFKLYTKPNIYDTVIISDIKNLTDKFFNFQLDTSLKKLELYKGNEAYIYDFFVLKETIINHFKNTPNLSPPTAKVNIEKSFPLESLPNEMPLGYKNIKFVSKIKFDKGILNENANFYIVSFDSKDDKDGRDGKNDRNDVIKNKIEFNKINHLESIKKRVDNEFSKYPEIKILQLPSLKDNIIKKISDISCYKTINKHNLKELHISTVQKLDLFSENLKNKISPLAKSIILNKNQSSILFNRIDSINEAITKKLNEGEIIKSKIDSLLNSQIIYDINDNKKTANKDLIIKKNTALPDLNKLTKSKNPNKIELDIWTDKIKQLFFYISKIETNGVNDSLPLQYATDQINIIKAANTITQKLNSIKNELVKQEDLLNNYHLEQTKLNENTKNLQAQMMESFELRFVVDTVHTEFSNGTIKNISICGKVGCEKYILTNRYPISISSKNDRDFFKHVKLLECRENKFSAKLSSVMDFNPIFQLNSEDYSPVDSIYNFIPSKNPKILFKEKHTEILKAKIFTDIVGFNSDNPNGLIQTEISKRINLYTRAFSNRTKPWKTLSYSTYYHFINYYEPKMVWSKIEDNNRSMEIQKINVPNPSGSDSTSYLFSSGLEYLRYSYLQIRPLQFNAFVINVPRAKLSFGLDLGSSFYLTSIANKIIKEDSTTKEISTEKSNLTSFSANFDAYIHIKPDTRFGVVITGSAIYFRSLNKKFTQAMDENSIRNNEKNSSPWLVNIRLDAYYRPFKRIDGEIFFRFNSFFSASDFNYNFLQAQLGTTFRILK